MKGGPKSNIQRPKSGVFWSAPAERGGDGALVCDGKRRRASLAAAVQIAPAATSASDIRDIKPPVPIPNALEWLWWGLAALAAAVVLFTLWNWWRRREVNRPVPPVIPAHVRARQKLADALALISRPKPFVTAVSDTARMYLEERFEFRAPERTTEEFLRELSGTNLLVKEQKESLGEFLASCDLVKFAKYEPSETELRGLHGSAVKLVEETEPRQTAGSEPQMTNTEMIPVMAGPEKIANHKS
jgi:hypothetical protein